MIEFWLGSGDSLTDLISSHDSETPLSWCADVMFKHADHSVDEYSLVPDGLLTLTDMIDVIREKLSLHYGEATADCGFRLWRSS